eukprot:4638250-Prymnesium_polylepis.1
MHAACGHRRRVFGYLCFPLAFSAPVPEITATGNPLSLTRLFFRSTVCGARRRGAESETSDVVPPYVAEI